MQDGGRAAWEARHRAAEPLGAPSPFVVAALDLLTVRGCGRALDVACGRGRHALLLAARGYRVEAIDYALPALRALGAAARAAHLEVACMAADVTRWVPPPGRYDLVVVVHFLARDAWPALRAAVAPGGALLIETFLRGHERHGPPRSPDHLLAPGELDDLCHDWHVISRHEGETERDGRPAVLAGILARRPPGGPVI